jgi:hypothetical protein
VGRRGAKEKKTREASGRGNGMSPSDPVIPAPSLAIHTVNDYMLMTTELFATQVRMIKK